MKLPNLSCWPPVYKDQPILKDNLSTVTNVSISLGWLLELGLHYFNACCIIKTSIQAKSPYGTWPFMYTSPHHRQRPHSPIWGQDSEISMKELSSNLQSQAYRIPQACLTCHESGPRFMSNIHFQDRSRRYISVYARNIMTEPWLLWQIFPKASPKAPFTHIFFLNQMYNIFFPKNLL